VRVAHDVVVLLGSRMVDLEEHGTRWRAVLRRWAKDPRVSSLTAVDFPRFGRRLRVREQPCWLDGCRSLELAVPGRVGGGPGSGIGWGLAAAALGRALPASTTRVLVAATPLSAPLLTRVPAGRTAFDAVDDWRALPSVAEALPRVVEGYRVAARADAVSTVSPVLTDRLRADFGMRPVTIGNGVELESVGEAPAGLPEGPFAVYVGSVQERVDLDLVGAVAERLPVVVAGPATPAQADRLRALPLTWLGPVPVTQIPALLARAGVGLVPHTIDALTESMAPMKLLEYVAAGLPVVSTPLPDLDRHPRVVVASDGPGFASAAERLAAEGPRPAPPEWLAAHGWDGVSDRLLRLVTGASGG
jgi:teichuronic acid biosynthesis glycosyltransferase TuaH